MNSLATIAMIVLGMVALTILEAVIPLHDRGPSHRAHLAPNLWLTSIILGTNAVMNVLVLSMLAAAEPRSGLLRGIVAVLALDLSFYVAHRLMHENPKLWRFHAVHHSDPAVDVTTTIRQHPVEGLVRYAFLAVTGLAVGASPSAFAVYRVWSVVAGLFEHANVRLPERLDALLSLVVTTPNFHKIHHSRNKAETNTNYGNITSLFDRLFASFTSSSRGVNIVYGLDGFDEPVMQTTIGLLVPPLWPLPGRRDDDANDPHGQPAAVHSA